MFKYFQIFTTVFNQAFISNEPFEIGHQVHNKDLIRVTFYNMLYKSEHPVQRDMMRLIAN